MATRLRPGFKAEAERIALDLRGELGLGPADRLDPRALAAHLGIPVVPLPELGGDGATDASVARLLDPEAGFSALTVCAGPRRLIVYNQRHPPGRRASSLAHELAHVILDHPAGPVFDQDRARLWDEEMEAELEHMASHERVTPAKLLERLRRDGRDEMVAADIRIRKAIDLITESAKPIEMDRAEAREKLWTPDDEAAGGGELWTPGS